MHSFGRRPLSSEHTGAALQLLPGKIISRNAEPIRYGSRSFSSATQAPVRNSSVSPSGSVLQLNREDESVVPARGTPNVVPPPPPSVPSEGPNRPLLLNNSPTRILNDSFFELFRNARDAQRAKLLRDHLTPAEFVSPNSFSQLLSAVLEISGVDAFEQVVRGWERSGALDRFLQLQDRCPRDAPPRAGGRQELAPESLCFQVAQTANVCARARDLTDNSALVDLLGCWIRRCADSVAAPASASDRALSAGLPELALLANALRRVVGSGGLSGVFRERLRSALKTLIVGTDAVTDVDYATPASLGVLAHALQDDRELWALLEPTLIKKLRSAGLEQPGQTAPLVSGRSEGDMNLNVLSDVTTVIHRRSTFSSSADPTDRIARRLRVQSRHWKVEELTAVCCAAAKQKASRVLRVVVDRDLVRDPGVFDARGAVLMLNAAARVKSASSFTSYITRKMVSRLEQILHSSDEEVAVGELSLAIDALGKLRINYSSGTAVFPKSDRDYMVDLKRFDALASRLVRTFVAAMPAPSPKRTSPDAVRSGATIRDWANVFSAACGRLGASLDREATSALLERSERLLMEEKFEQPLDVVAAFVGFGRVALRIRDAETGTSCVSPKTIQALCELLLTGPGVLTRSGTESEHNSLTFAQLTDMVVSLDRLAKLVRTRGRRNDHPDSLRKKLSEACVAVCRSLSNRFRAAESGVTTPKPEKFSSSSQCVVNFVCAAGSTVERNLVATEELTSFLDVSQILLEGLRRNSASGQHQLNEGEKQRLARLSLLHPELGSLGVDDVDISKGGE